MAFKLPDGVKQQSTATGSSGNVSLDLVVTGAKQFNEEFSNGDTTIVVRRDSTDQEVFYGTYNSAGDDISYGTVISSTNNGARVNWSGTTDVFVAPSGSKLLLRDSNGNTFDGSGESPAKEPAISKGTKSSGTFTPEPSNGALQTITNGGAFTLAPPTEQGMFLLIISNNASAGAITTSGFGEVIGDAFDTTNGNDFECLIMNDGDTSSLQIRAKETNT